MAQDDLGPEATAAEALRIARRAAWDVGFLAGAAYGAARERWYAAGVHADPFEEPSPPRNPWKLAKDR